MKDHASESTRVLLIGGASNVGKSTLAERLSRKLAWDYLSTDQLARHPGRPWRNDQSNVPDDVIAHYSSLSTAELIDSVDLHYQQNVWPIVEAMVRSRTNNLYDRCLVLEGSAILPEAVASSQFMRCRSIWLTSPNDLIVARIKSGSQFTQRSHEEQGLIDTFIDRTLAFNNNVEKSVNCLGQKLLDTSSANALETLASWLRD